MPQRTKSAIRSIILENLPEAPTQGLLARDQFTALEDLRKDSAFQPAGTVRGPFDIKLSIEESRLVFRISNAAADKIPALVLSLKPYKRLIKDYFMIVESYDRALKDGGPSKIEAIDMGRRGLHNEGAALLLERLKDRIAMDADTARRLFTLICVLHGDMARLGR